jgi:DNA (cytosine-5)-methyltransferase 3A
MKVLSLFDGISCGRAALERAGVPVETYYASEIDKYAMSVTQAMYPNTIQIGDVCKIDFTQYIGKVDMIIGGSPCQDLSIAKQNRQGLQGERSRLFWEYIKALTIIKPKYFLLENVASMKNEDRDAITAVLRGIYPETECVMINSALVSAQQRKRYYWTNWHVEQPQDKGILLKDILERQIDERYMMTDKNIQHCCRSYGSKAQNITGQDKCPTLCAAMGCGGGNVPFMFAPVADREKSHAVISSVGRTTEREYFKKNQGQLVFEPVTYLDKAHCLDANYYKGASLEHSLTKHKRTQVFEPVGVNRLGGFYGQVTRWGIYDQDGKAPTITASMGMGGGHVPMIPERVGTLDGLGKGQANRIYSVRGKSVCLNANGGGGGAKTGLYKIDLPDGDYIVRKLTPRECARLQTYPERCFDVANISNTQWYKAFGNGWTVDVIAHIFKQIPTEN